MRVHGGGAVTGEVLHTGGQAGALQAAHGSGCVPADHLRTRSETARADHRVVVGTVDVAAGGKVEGEAEGAEIGAHGRVDLLGQVRVVHSTQGGITRIGAAVRVRKAGDIASLFINR